MNNLTDNLTWIKDDLNGKVTLVAVSKNHPVSKIKEAYAAGQRNFDENKVQELMEKIDLLPKDIRWHLVGHLQTNKVKYIAPFIYMIHSLDSAKLAAEISAQAQKNERVIDVLLQVRIAKEETKFGLTEDDAEKIIKNQWAGDYPGISIRGLMGMATFTENESHVREEFKVLRDFFREVKEMHFTNEVSFDTLCMGMTGDYRIAIEEGSNMVRIGTAIFGSR
ncbi:MAG: YggS family pyridoxal phosphate-dependent enzyme [Bacteroidota bacterium]|nr:YggS family pyridoxal phosphate-dependent enzyme [Bacteroidota bacterium]